MLPVAILAGGLATRLRPVTESIPKALLPVAGHPFLFHQLSLLRRKGVTRVVICVGYLGNKIEEHFGDGKALGLDISYSYDGTALLGTGGALRRAVSLIGNNFLVLYGDSYLDCDYGAVASAFCSSGRLGLMTVYRNDNRWDKSNVLVRNGEIVTYDKKNRLPSMRHIDYGLGAIRADALNSYPEGATFDLQEVYSSLLRQRQLAAYEVNERFYEIGSPDGLMETDVYLGGRTIS